MTFDGCECGLKFLRGEEQPSWSGWRFWKILVNRSTQESMPMTAIPEGKIICIGGDGGGSRQNVQYFWQDFILLRFRVVEKKSKQRLLAPH